MREVLRRLINKQAVFCVTNWSCSERVHGFFWVLNHSINTYSAVGIGGSLSATSGGDGFGYRARFWLHLWNLGASLAYYQFCLPPLTREVVTPSICRSKVVTELGWVWCIQEASLSFHISFLPHATLVSWMVKMESAIPWHFLSHLKLCLIPSLGQMASTLVQRRTNPFSCPAFQLLSWDVSGSSRSGVTLEDGHRGEISVSHVLGFCTVAWTLMFTPKGHSLLRDAFTGSSAFVLAGDSLGFSDRWYPLYGSFMSF